MKRLLRWFVLAVVWLVGAVVALIVLGMIWERATAPKVTPGWTLFVYPIGSDAGIFTPGFASQDFCLLAGRNAVEAYRLSRTSTLKDAPPPTFECGLQCRFEPNYPSIAVCKETVD